MKIYINKLIVLPAVPPEKPVVVDRWGRVINATTLGPHEEGDDVLLTCRVLGGKMIIGVREQTLSACHPSCPVVLIHPYILLINTEPAGILARNGWVVVVAEKLN